MKLAAYLDDLPAPDDAIIAHEETAHGWRGLTAKGELLDVRSRNGRKPAVPDGDAVMMRGNRALSRGPIGPALRLDDYLAHFDRALALTRRNRHVEALAQIDAAVALAPTLFARFNRALVLLSLGHWGAGFAEYRHCETHPALQRPPVREALARGLTPWRGEHLAGKRLLLLHAHGFGDTIMTLRFLPQLRDMGAEVSLVVPQPLADIAASAATFAKTDVHFSESVSADFFCPMLHLIGMLGITPYTVCGDPYLRVDRHAVGHWRRRLGPGRHIGIAWSPGAQSIGDYPRAIPLDRLVAALAGAQLHSVQKQGAEEAQALGVRVHDFADFADCAALMLAMDRIVTIDTAAAHLAGAIGHPDVDLLLSHWASWRWIAPWYATVSRRWQAAPDDWDSALAQLGGGRR